MAKVVVEASPSQTVHYEITSTGEQRALTTSSYKHGFVVGTLPGIGKSGDDLYAILGIVTYGMSARLWRSRNGSGMNSSRSMGWSTMSRTASSAWLTRRVPHRQGGGFRRDIHGQSN